MIEGGRGVDKKGLLPMYIVCFNWIVKFILKARERGAIVWQLFINIFKIGRVVEMENETKYSVVKVGFCGVNYLLIHVRVVPSFFLYSLSIYRKCISKRYMYREPRWKAKFRLFLIVFFSFPGKTKRKSWLMSKMWKIIYSNLESFKRKN